ncbi:MAG: spore coat U domain-containing protein, partial [Rhodobacterales bacterium]
MCPGKGEVRSATALRNKAYLLPTFEGIPSINRPCMKSYFLPQAIALCGMMGMSSSLNAQTATTSFGVSITINAECLVATPAALVFPATGVLITAIDSSTDLEVTCTSGTAYQIGLDAGQGTGATTAARLMTQGAGTVGYQLFRESARTLNWGDATGADTLGSVGTGITQTFTVFGRVPPQPTPATGTYNDEVTVTVTY